LEAARGASRTAQAGPAAPGAAEIAKTPWAIRKLNTGESHSRRFGGDRYEGDPYASRRALKALQRRDVVSRWDVLEAHHRATSLAAAQFLETLLERLPFPVRALQVEAEANSPPSSRKPASKNSCRCSASAQITETERPRGALHRTHNEEFYEVQADSDQLPALNQQLRRLGKNLQLRKAPSVPRLPHPVEFLTRWKSNPRRQSVTNLLDEYSRLDAVYYSSYILDIMKT